MKSSDLSTIAAVGVLVASLFAFLASFGVQVPLWVPASIPLAVGVGIFGLRAYVAFRGADNTSVDESLEKAEKLIQSARKAVTSFSPSEAPTVKDRPTVPPEEQ